MMSAMRKRYKIIAVIFAILLSLSLVVACGLNDDDPDDDDNNNGDLDNGDGDSGSDNDDPGTDINLTLDMELPDSITGGRMSGTSSLAVQSTPQSDPGLPCAFMGSEEDDFFENGYEMTKFMVSAIATWTCIADTLIDIAATVDHDGEIHETDNVFGEDDYDEEDPTHYSVTDDSDTQTTIRFWYGYPQAEPPQPNQDPQFFLSWNAPENDDLTGRLIIDGQQLNPEDYDEDDPAMVRMDFTYGDSQEQADMYLQFDDLNEWAEGFRIQVTKDLSASSLGQVFTALGLIKMKDQFIDLGDIDQIPDVHMFTVSDAIGKGAALATFSDIAIPLVVSEIPDNHLGNYLFDKDDIYFFKSNGNWDWIDKSITHAILLGNRNTPATGGSDDYPSLDQIAEWLGLPSDYFTGSKCFAPNDNCTDLLNAVFNIDDEDGFAGQEPNQGSDPGDWRSDALLNMTTLPSIYPNGENWDGAFDFSYTP